MKRVVAPTHAKKVHHQARLIIYRSLDFETWEPVLPDDVPKYLTRADVVKRLVDGEACQLESKDPHWYRAEKAEIH